MTIRTARRRGSAAHLPAGRSVAGRSLTARPTELCRSEVVEVVDEDTVQVRRIGAAPSALDTAELSVLGYAPRPGDRVVVRRGSDAWFVIGVLGEARRRMALRCEGDDVVVSAVGRVVLRAESVELRGDQSVLVETGRLETRARRIFEAAEDVYREAEGLSQTRAGRLRVLVEGALQLFARRTTLASEEETVVDGRRVLLG